MKRQIERLRSALSVECPAPLDWGLSPSEAALWRALLANDLVTREMAYLALYGPKRKTDQHIIAVLLCRLRRKAEPYGAKIETLHRTGYRLVDRAGWLRKLKPEN